MNTTTHTIDEALNRFTLISEQGDGETTACVMTALSWVAGEAWTDHPKCSHPILASLAIRANDYETTTPAQRADIVRAGATGIIDTWWLPGEVVAWCISAGMKAEGPVERCIATLAAVTAWKNDKDRPDLRGANLRYADLGGANLRGANLGGANLGGADLGYADLRGANLGGANLGYADLRGANLGGADLGGADLGGADLRGANLGGADLRGANLRCADLGGANLRGANLGGADLGGADLRGAYCNCFTVPPAGWTVNTRNWRMEVAP